MALPLYKDKFVQLFQNHIVLSMYYFPTGTSKTIPLQKFRAVYYKKQQCMKDLIRTKDWGMSFSNVWWACDLRRHIHGPSNEKYNVVVDTGSAIKKGFSVENIEIFIETLRPLTYAIFRDDIPQTLFRKLCKAESQTTLSPTDVATNDQDVGHRS
ncbi:hypothetical protein Ddc_05298 [Ditylenchus destructor]|nr:hypothetical protein Ddc_05298 [Ditylenchus destructor]